eukprot:2541_1
MGNGQFGLFKIRAPLDVELAASPWFPTFITISFSLYFLITTTSFILRLYQITRFKQKDKIIQYLHIFAIFCIINFLIWTFLKAPHHGFPCHVSSYLLWTFFGCMRSSIYSFLMLTLYKLLEIPQKLVIAFIVIICIWFAVLTYFLLEDLLFIKGYTYCWRALSEHTMFIYNTSVFIDSIISLFMFILFTVKFRGIQKKILSTIKQHGDAKQKMYRVFINRVVLGLIALSGTIIVAISTQLIGALQPIFFASDATANCICIVLMFEENFGIFRCICCCCGEKQKQLSEEDMKTVIDQQKAEIKALESELRKAEKDETNIEKQPLTSRTQMSKISTVSNGLTQDSMGVTLFDPSVDEQ